MWKGKWEKELRHLKRQVGGWQWSCFYQVEQMQAIVFWEQWSIQRELCKGRRESDGWQPSFQYNLFQVTCIIIDLIVCWNGVQLFSIWFWPWNGIEILKVLLWREFILIVVSYLCNDWVTSLLLVFQSINL